MSQDTPKTIVSDAEPGIPFFMGRQPAQWRETARENPKLEIFQRMPFFQAALLVLGEGTKKGKHKYFSAKLADPDGAVPEHFLGQANMVEGNYEQGESFIVLAEIPNAYLAQENLLSGNIDDEICSYLPLKFTMKKEHVGLEEITAKDAEGTNFGAAKLREMLGAQAQQIAQEAQPEIIAAIIEARTKVSPPKPFGMMALSNPSQHQAAPASQPQPQDTTAMKAYADIFDISVAKPEEMVELMPDVWGDMESAQKHVDAAKKSLVGQLRNISPFGMTPDKQIVEALKGTFNPAVYTNRLNDLCENLGLNSSGRLVG